MFRIDRTGSARAGTKSESRCWIAHGPIRAAGADIGRLREPNTSFAQVP